MSIRISRRLRLPAQPKQNEVVAGQYRVDDLRHYRVLVTDHARKQRVFRCRRQIRFWRSSSLTCAHGHSSRSETGCRGERREWLAGFDGESRARTLPRIQEILADEWTVAGSALFPLSRMYGCRGGAFDPQTSAADLREARTTASACLTQPPHDTQECASQLDSVLHLESFKRRSGCLKPAPPPPVFCDSLYVTMSKELPETDFQRFWRRLQQIGLNAYEARSYLVLVGHPRFKALELAARSHVPRQKIYEVLDSLIEKGFAQVVQEKTKLFSAVEPSLAVPSYLARRAETMQHELTEQARFASSLVEDLHTSYAEGQGGRGTLDYLRIVSEPGQTAAQYRQMMLGREGGVSRVLASAVCGRSPRRATGETGAAAGRVLPDPARKGKHGRRAPRAPRGIQVAGDRDPVGGFAADEAGGVR